MATVYGIQKETTLDSGLTFNHYGVSGIILNPAQNKATIIFSGWKDITARLTGKSSIAGSNLLMDISLSDLGMNSPMSNPLAEIAQTVMTYALANVEELSGGQVVSQVI